jgi:CHRD domain
MTGAEEAPSPGDPDGAGTAKITLDAAKGEVCYELMVQNVDKSNAAHVHTGAAGQAGPPVVNLDPPTEGSSKGCTTVDAKVIADIQANPGNHYVNVHNAEFPGGAVRGQLAAGVMNN